MNDVREEIPRREELAGANGLVRSAFGEPTSTQPAKRPWSFQALSP
jgi:hypothetical protein